MPSTRSQSTRSAHAAGAPSKMDERAPHRNDDQQITNHTPSSPLLRLLDDDLLQAVCTNLEAIDLARAAAACTHLRRAALAPEILKAIELPPAVSPASTSTAADGAGTASADDEQRRPSKTRRLLAPTPAPLLPLPVDSALMLRLTPAGRAGPCSRRGLYMDH